MLIFELHPENALGGFEYRSLELQFVITQFQTP